MAGQSGRRAGPEEADTWLMRGCERSPGGAEGGITPQAVALRGFGKGRTWATGGADRRRRAPCPVLAAILIKQPGLGGETQG